MAGVSIVVTLEGVSLEAVAAALQGGSTEPLMTNIGAILESSQRERIEETKTAPDGTKWVPSRGPGTTLLATGRHLRDSLAFIASADQVEAGSSWEFAHIHQDGAVIKPKSAERLAFRIGGRKVFAKQVKIPARPFVGVSADDEKEIQRVTVDWLRQLLPGAK